MPGVRVLLCDDSPGFPSLVAAWLRDDPRFEHAGTARSGAELLELAAGVDADAVLLDLVLPDVENPTELVRELRRRRPGMRVVLVSSLRSPELARAAEAAGADAYCHKLTNSRELSDTLYGVATA